MEGEKQKLYTVVAVVALVTLLVSCIAGALAGGLAGFVTGQRQGRLAAERSLEGGIGILPGIREELRERWQDQQPWAVPELEEELPPFGMLPQGVQGALIVEVIADSPAEQAGLEPGDVIVGVDQMPVDANHPLPDVIGRYKPRDRVTVHVWREGRDGAFALRLGQHPEDPDRAYLGVYFEMLPGGQEFGFPRE